MRIPYLPAVLIALMAFLLGAPTGASASTPTSVEWQVGDTLFIAGRDLTISRHVAGSLTATGETIAVTRESNVSKDVWIAARRVAVEGEIGGELSIRSQDALINGHVKGDVSFYGVHLAFGPDARIDGNVNYYSATPAEIDSGAHIAGNMHSKVWDENADGSVYRPLRPMPDRDYGWHLPGYRISWPGAIFFGFIAGVLALAAPAAALRFREAAGARTAMAFLVGVVWLIGTPILAVMSAITIVGLPLAFIVILLWPLGVLLGLIVAIIVLGEVLAGRMTPFNESATRLILGIAAATLLLWIGISLPGIGGLVWLAAVTFGVGALVLSAQARSL